MSKIEKLTASQEEDLRRYVQECLVIGRSCEPADRPAAEVAIKSMYAAIGEAEPKFWWCDGPATGSIIRAMMQPIQPTANLRANLGDNLRDNLYDNLYDNLGANLYANLGDNLRANLGANLRDNLYDNLRDNLGDNLYANLRDNLGANLGDNLRDNLRDNLGANLYDNLYDNLYANLDDNLYANLDDNLYANLRDNLGANLGDNLRANLGDNLGDNLYWYFWGSHEIYWPAYYLWPHVALRKMHTDEQVEQLGWWMILAKSCGWWQPFENICFVCERPIKQAVDDRGRLHCVGGPALLCRDGWPVHAIHGVRVPAYVVEHPEQIDVAKIDAEQNAEVRRVMLERFGTSRYILESGIKPVAEDRFGRVYRKEIPGDEPLVMAHVVNSTSEPDGTRKDYWLRVNPELRPLLADNKLGEPQEMTARNAVASTFGMRGEEYAPEVET